MQVEHCAYGVQEIPEPGTFDEALSSPHAKEWKCATNSEYQSHDTWRSTVEKAKLYDSRVG